jgi:Zn-dependent protease
VHEVAHGYVANLLGDRTALMLGRLTLNPAKHIDPIGTIAMPLLCVMVGSFIFGWAKPVPINPRNFKNFRKDTSLVAFAGPCSNFIMAIMWAILLKMILLLWGKTGSLANIFFIKMCMAGVIINLLLMILNLLPIPPLDGSKMLITVLPNEIYRIYTKIEPYGFIILIVLLYTQTLFAIIGPPIVWLQGNLFDLLNIK